MNPGVNLEEKSVTSDRDFLEVFQDGLQTVSSVVGGDPDASIEALESGSYLITHNLGTVPLVRAYADLGKNGTWFDTNKDTVSLIWLTTVSTTTTTKIIINHLNSTFTNIPIYYRIYNLGSKAVTSDTRIDKIFKNQDSFPATLAAAASSASPTTTTLTLPHGQGEVVNWTLQHSEDGTTWYTAGQRNNGPPDTTTGPPGGPYTRYFYTTAYGSCDTSNFYITLRNAYTTGAKTIYCRYMLDFRI